MHRVYDKCQPTIPSYILTKGPLNVVSKEWGSVSKSLIEFLRQYLSTRVIKLCYEKKVQFSHSVVSDCLRPHESKHAKTPCPSPTPGVHSDSRPSSQ